MTQPKPAQRILRQAFAALTDVQLGRQKRHVEKGTTICCGEFADQFVDGDGGG